MTIVLVYGFFRDCQEKGAHPGLGFRKVYRIDANQTKEDTEEMQTALIVLAALLAVVALAILSIILWHRGLMKKGVLGHRKVMSQLRRYAAIRRYRVLENVTIRSGDREAVIECLMVGFFGVLLVYAMNDTAEYYGDDKSKEWVRVTPKTRVKVPNTMKQASEAAELLREVFSKQKVYNIKVESATVFCGSVKKSLVAITNPQNLMLLGEFSKYLHRAKFEKDNDVDVPVLTEMIEKACK